METTKPNENELRLAALEAAKHLHPSHPQSYPKTETLLETADKVYQWLISKAK